MTIRLRERKAELESFKAPITQDTLVELEQIRIKQKELGFGMPDLEPYSRALNREHDLQVLAELLKEKLVTLIEKPRINLSDSHTLGQMYFLPKIVGVRLSALGYRSEVTGVCKNPFRSALYFSAPIPLMPETVQNYTKRILERFKAVRCYLLFEAQWKPNPNADPVIIADVHGNWIKICAWDGDRELIESLLKEKQSVTIA